MTIIQEKERFKYRQLDEHPPTHGLPVEFRDDGKLDRNPPILPKNVMYVIAGGDKLNLHPGGCESKLCCGAPENQL